jgi:hypothetical protein
MITKIDPLSLNLPLCSFHVRIRIHFERYEHVACGSNQWIVTPHGSMPTATSAIFTARSTSMTDTDPERPHAT